MCPTKANDQEPQEGAGKQVLQPSMTRTFLLSSLSHGLKDREAAQLRCFQTNWAHLAASNS